MAGGGLGLQTLPRDMLRPAPAPQSTKAVYDRILDLRIATPQIVINYAMFLEEHKYFEESFKVRGVTWGRQTAVCPLQCLGRCVSVLCRPNEVPQTRELNGDVSS